MIKPVNSLNINGRPKCSEPKLISAKPSADMKNCEISSNEVLNSYGKAFALSFKGQKRNYNLRLDEILQFKKKLITDIKRKYGKDSPVAKDLSSLYLSSNSAYFVRRILLDNLFSSNKDFMLHFPLCVYTTDSKAASEGRLYLANVISSNKELRNDPEFIGNSYKIFSSVNSKEEAEIKMQAVKLLYNDDYKAIFKESAFDLIKSIDTNNQLRFVKDFIEYPNFKENFGELSEVLFTLVKYCNLDEKTSADEIISTILTDEAAYYDVTLTACQDGSFVIRSQQIVHDNEFNSLIEGIKHYYSNGKSTKTKSRYDLPEITRAARKNSVPVFAVNGKATDIPAPSDCEKPELSLAEFCGEKYLLINGQKYSDNKLCESETHYVGGETEFYNRSDKLNNIVKVIEKRILPDNTLEVIETKPSIVLPGSFNVTKTVYSEDSEKIAEIPLSRVTSDSDGSIDYIREFETGDFHTKNRYKKTPDGYEYSYLITDNNGGELLNLNRSLKKCSDGKTISYLNGKKYVTEFDFRNQKIYISEEGCPSVTLDLYNKMSDNSDAEIASFMEFLRNVPGDKLKLLANNDYVRDINFNSFSEFSGKTLCCEDDLFILAHELGHAIDGANFKLSRSRSVKETYLREMRDFMLKYPETYTEYIHYFGLDGGSGGDGLSEFFAEVCALLTVYGSENEVLKTRSSFIARYFPETVAKIAAAVQAVSELL